MIVEGRIRSLSKFDYTSLTGPQLDELLSVWRAARGPASQEFSVADLRPEAVTTRLASLGMDDVIICWPAASKPISARVKMLYVFKRI